VDVLADRCAGLDLHKDTVTAAVRTPDGRGGRGAVVREFSTFTADLVQLADWLAGERVTEVVMEATGVYWRPVWHVLDDHGGYDLMLVNARHVKNLPGRKTDVGDASWLAQLLECGLLRGSFVPTKEMARLRDLTRYRTKLTQERTREIQRVQKLLEDAKIKLDSVISDVMGKSAREMLDALLAGEDDVETMAQMARTRMRPKIPQLRLALEGRFDDHHRLMLGLHLRHIDDLTAMIVELDTKVDELMAPFDEAATRLLSIPGVAKRTAEVIVAEIGVDMSRFPTAGHLASWVGLCPGNNESGGKRRTGRARKGDEALRTAMCEAAWAAAHTRNTYLAAQYRRFKRRMGTKSEGKAIFALAHTMIVIVWHVFDRNTSYNELGADYLDHRKDADARKRYLIRELERLANTVILQPAA
jgi:transposase